MEELIKFTSREPLVPWMSQVQYQEGYLYATDAYIMVRKSGEPIEVESPTKYQLKDWFKQSEKIGSFSADKLAKWIESLEGEKEPIYWNNFQDCDECDADGQVECNYGHYHDCPDCNGEGRIGKEDKTKITGYSFNEKAGVKMYGRYINIHQILKILTLPLSEIQVYGIVNKDTQLMLVSECYEIVVLSQSSDNKPVFIFEP